MNYIVLTCGTILLVLFSWHFSIKEKRYHGISRFFSFESIFILFLFFYSFQSFLVREFLQSGKNFLYSVKAETNIFSNVDIDCFIKQNNKSYIPGTEIKGAIRTAVAYHLLQNEDHWKYLKKELEKLQFKMQMIS